MTDHDLRKTKEETAQVLHMDETGAQTGLLMKLANPSSDRILT